MLEHGTELCHRVIKVNVFPGENQAALEENKRLSIRERSALSWEAGGEARCRAKAKIRSCAGMITRPAAEMPSGRYGPTDAAVASGPCSAATSI